MEALEVNRAIGSGEGEQVRVTTPNSIWLHTEQLEVEVEKLRQRATGNFSRGYTIR